MEEFGFHEGAFPPGYLVDFEISLFNRPEHLALQSDNGWHSFSVLDRKNENVVAVFFVRVENEEARSPFRSPYGSIECRRDISLATLYKFIEFIESRLRANGVRKLIIKNPPQRYLKHAHFLETFLFNQGYHVVDAEMGAIIPIREEFTLGLDAWEKRKLRQAHEAPLVFRTLTNEHLDEIYLFILACRKQKNYSLSMTLAELRKVAARFPDHYVLSCVYHNEVLAAASISIRVRRDVLYNFYSDHDKAFDSFSPVVFLMEGMYKYCKEQSVRQLDLGTSAVDGKPNFGLLDFKMRLGGKPTPKLTFAKEFA